MSLSATDRLDILELLTRADDAASRRDVGGYVDLFAEEAVLDGEKGEHRGRAALAEAVGPVWASEGAASVHLTCNPVVDDVPGQPDRATATSVLLIVDPGPPVVLRSMSGIVQHLYREGPVWRIARRSVGRTAP